MLGYRGQRFQVRPFEFAHRCEQLGSRSEVDGFRVEFGHGLFVAILALCEP